MNKLSRFVLTTVGVLLIELCEKSRSPLAYLRRVPSIYRAQPGRR